MQVGWDDPAWAIFMGFEHERIHNETSTDKQKCTGSGKHIKDIMLEKAGRPRLYPDATEAPSALHQLHNDDPARAHPINGGLVYNNSPFETRNQVYAAHVSIRSCTMRGPTVTYRKEHIRGSRSLRGWLSTLRWG